jgi:hypothetical protein
MYVIKKEADNTVIRKPRKELKWHDKEWSSEPW